MFVSLNYNWDQSWNQNSFIKHWNFTVRENLSLRFWKIRRTDQEAIEEQTIKRQCAKPDDWVTRWRATTRDGHRSYPGVDQPLSQASRPPHPGHLHPLTPVSYTPLTGHPLHCHLSPAPVIIHIAPDLLSLLSFIHLVLSLIICIITQTMCVERWCPAGVRVNNVPAIWVSWGWSSWGQHSARHMARSHLCLTVTPWNLAVSNVKVHSDGTIAIAICLSQPIGYTGISVIVANASCQHLHWILYSPWLAIKNS